MAVRGSTPLLVTLLTAGCAAQEVAAPPEEIEEIEEIGEVVEASNDEAAAQSRELPEPVLTLDTDHVIITNPIFLEGAVVVGLEGGGLVAIDIPRDLGKSRPAVRWRQSIDSPIVSGLSGAHGRIHATLFDNSTATFDGHSGEQLWRRPGSTWSTAAPLPVGDLVLASDPGEAVALDSASGRELWRAPLDGTARVTPAADDSLIFLATDFGFVHAVTPSRGEEQWRRRLGAKPVAGPTVTGDLLLIPVVGNRIIALNTATGAMAWSTTLTSPLKSAVTAGVGLAVVGTDTGEVHALDLSDGERLWSSIVEGPVSANPHIAEGLLYIPSESETLHILNSATGEELSRRPLGSMGRSAPGDNDVIVCLGEHRSVTCYPKRPPAGSSWIGR